MSNQLLLLSYLLVSAVFASAFMQKADLSIAKSLAIGLLSPLIIVVSVVQLLYLLFGIQLLLIIATNESKTVTGPTKKETGDE